MCIWQAVTSWPWGNIAAWAGVAVALGATITQARRQRFALGVDLILRLEKDFFKGPEMRNARSSAALALLKNQNTQPDAADYLLNFFETLGIMTRRGALDLELVWHTFFHCLHRYWLAAEDYIREVQKKNPSSYKDFEWLHNQVVKIEERSGPSNDLKLMKNSDELAKFLEDEKR